MTSTLEAFQKGLQESVGPSWHVDVILSPNTDGYEIRLRPSVYANIFFGRNELYQTRATPDAFLARRLRELRGAQGMLVERLTASLEESIA